MQRTLTKYFKTAKYEELARNRIVKLLHQLSWCSSVRWRAYGYSSQWRFFRSYGLESYFGSDPLMLTSFYFSPWFNLYIYLILAGPRVLKISMDYETHLRWKINKFKFAKSWTSSSAVWSSNVLQYCARTLYSPFWWFFCIFNKSSHTRSLAQIISSFVQIKYP